MQLPNLIGMESRGHGTAQSLPVLSGMGPAGAHPFPENLSFELGKNSQECSHRAASGCSQIQRLRQRYEPDTQMFQFLEGSQQIRYRSAPAIQSPHQHDVDLPPPCRIQQLFPKLPLRSATADLLYLQSDRPA